MGMTTQNSLTTESAAAGTTTIRSASIAVQGVPEPVLAQRSDDQALVRAILEADPDAFSRLYKLYADRIFCFAVKRLGDASEAEDVVQDTFLSLTNDFPKDVRVQMYFVNGDPPVVPAAP